MYILVQLQFFVNYNLEAQYIMNYYYIRYRIFLKCKFLLHTYIVKILV